MAYNDKRMNDFWGKVIAGAVIAIFIFIFQWAGCINN